MSETSKKPRPAYYNTYFWFAVMLAALGVYGLPFLGGEGSIRDPGQKFETGLPVMYFIAAAVMFVNGIVSHRQTLQAYEDGLVSNNNG